VRTVVDVTSGDLAVSWADRGGGVGSIRARFRRWAAGDVQNAQTPRRRGSR
jgi:hypothetical protein